MKWYLGALKKYAVFSGRATRQEFWTFAVVSVIVVVVLSLIEGLSGMASNTNQSVLATIYQVAVFFPTLAVGVRRMHDTNHGGFWIFVPIVNLVFALTDGTRGENRYGPDPRLVTQAA